MSEFGMPISDWNITQCNEKLVEYRQKKIRSSQLICDISRQIIKLNPKFTKIADKHAALEQCTMACIDCGDGDAARILFDKIQQDFPRDASRRAQRLYLMFFENTELTEVCKERDELLKKANTDQIILKRDITTLVDYGDMEGAIAELCKHLETYQTDDDSWLCLSDLYLEQGMYEKAAFCLEELVMKNPYTSHYHIRLGDIYYTWATLEQGNTREAQILENYNSAKFHYAHAVRLTLKAKEGTNMRSLFGWMQCSRALNTLRNAKKELQAIEDEKKIVEFAMTKSDITSMRNSQQTNKYMQQMFAQLNICKDKSDF